MRNLEILEKAIKEHRKIKFDYNNEGLRIGDPYVIYRNQNTENNLLDLYQTSGYSNTSEKIPGWRQFILDNISNLELQNITFEINELYNPSSEKYDNYIIKV